jgi:hypothetical protein
MDQDKINDFNQQLIACQQDGLKKTSYMVGCFMLLLFVLFVMLFIKYRRNVGQAFGRIRRRRR